MPEYECITCNYATSLRPNLDRHMQSKRHKRITTGDVTGSNDKYVCIHCNYSTNTHSPWQQHCNSATHISQICGKTEWSCVCGRFFHSSKAKTYHTRSCNSTLPTVAEQPTLPQSQPIAPTASPADSALILQMFQTIMQENSKVIQETTNKVMQENNKAMQENNNALIEAISSGKLGATTNNTLNDHSTTTNTMNLNVFLDEHCKDAMNLADFFAKLKVYQSDLPDVLNVKNPKAISNILQRELGKLSITERPIHCTDVKRKKMFVKNDDKWTSECGTDGIDRVINSACAHQYNAWGERVRNTDREDRAEQHYDDTAAMGMHVGTRVGDWDKPGNRMMQETQNGVCNMVFLSKEDARDVVNEKLK